MVYFVESDEKNTNILNCKISYVFEIPHTNQCVVTTNNIVLKKEDSICTNVDLCTI